MPYEKITVKVDGCCGCLVALFFVGLPIILLHFAIKFW